MPCPAESVCVVTERFSEGTCAPRCDSLAMRRCPSGAACGSYRGTDVCEPGGWVAEGSETSTGVDCAFGLIAMPHFDVDPLVYTCEPVCDSDEDCRMGEVCLSPGACAAPCEDAATCGPSATCVAHVCVSPRRLALMDCDGDGDVTLTGCAPGVDCDCAPGLVCDPEAIGGCAHPDPGTE